MQHFRSAVVIAGVLVSLACDRSSFALAVSPPDPKQRVAEYYKIYAEQSQVISPLKEGRALAVELPSVAKKLAFARDVPIPVRITLHDLRLVARPTDFSEKDRYATVTILSAEGTPIARVQTSSDAIGWSDGPQDWSTWSASAKIDLRATIASLPDGKYDIVCEWPAGRDRPEISTGPIRIVVAKVTAQQARQAAVLDPKDTVVTLSAHPDGLLTNHSTRPIYFAASIGGDSMLGSKVVDAGDKIWGALNRSSVFTPVGWADIDLGYCGNGVGRVVVQPGKSAKIAMHLPQNSGRFARVSVQWFYVDQPAKKYDGGTATSEVLEVPDAKL